MISYRGFIVRDKENYECIIVQDDGDGCPDLVKKLKISSKSEASIWLDDELCRLNTGKGIWE